MLSSNFIEIKNLTGSSRDSDQSSLEGLIVGDSRSVLPLLGNESVDMIHTSPPYNIEKPYAESTDDLLYSEYLSLIEVVFTESYRVLKPRTSLFFQTGYSQNNSDEVLPIDMVTYDMMRGIGFRLWDRIIWHYRGGLSFSRKFKNTHETILWWVKPDEKGEFQPSFDVDAVRESSISYDKRNNLLGKNPGNVWSEDRVAFGGKSRATSHVAIYPESITERLIRACTRPGDMVLDPFSGSGTTPAMARMLNRRWIGIEISDSYAGEALRRIQSKQASEVATVLSELVKSLVFKFKPATSPTSLKTVCFSLSNWLDGVDYKRYSEVVSTQFGIDICDVDKPGKIEVKKDKKPKVWLYFDELFITSEKEVNEEPVLLVSRLLDRVYPQRRKWNNIRKFLHSLEIIIKLHTLLADGPDTTIMNILESESGSYSLDKERDMIYFVTSEYDSGDKEEDDRMAVEQLSQAETHFTVKDVSGKLGIEAHE